MADNGQELPSDDEELEEMGDGDLVFDGDLMEEEERESSEEGADEKSGDSDREGKERYDATIPPRHSYLGETQELSGRTLVDENDYVSLPLFTHNSQMSLMLVPGQTLPMTVSHPVHVSMFRNIIAKDRIFGIVNTLINISETSSTVQYGTTAEIYEFHEQEIVGSISIKAKGRQRFRVISTRRETTGCVVGNVKILPEIRVGDPYEFMKLASLDKLSLPEYTNREEAQTLEWKKLGLLHTPNIWKVRRRNAALTQWPSWVYDQYDDQIISQKLVNEITSTTMIRTSPLKIPRDPQELSNWAAHNLPLQDSHRLVLLSLNTPIQRLRYLLSVITKCKVLVCLHCDKVITDTSHIFSMSIEGPQGMFVNEGGYVHEMFTVKKTSGLSYYGEPMTEHSWFPGYAWTIANCKNCHRHMGWKFTATRGKLYPQKFYGVTRKSVKPKMVEKTDNNEPIKHVI